MQGKSSTFIRLTGTQVVQYRAVAKNNLYLKNISAYQSESAFINTTALRKEPASIASRFWNITHATCIVFIQLDN